MKLLYSKVQSHSPEFNYMKISLYIVDDGQRNSAHILKKYMQLHYVQLFQLEAHIRVFTVDGTDTVCNTCLVTISNWRSQDSCRTLSCIKRHILRLMTMMTAVMITTTII
jgi:hypothetical protein